MSETRHITAVLPDYLTATKEAQSSKRDYKPVRYDLSYETEGLAPCVNEAHRAIQWWLNDALEGVQERVRWVTLHGSPGCGKTHLVRAATALIRANGKRAQTWKWRKLLDMLHDEVHYPGLWHWVTEMPYLALDDVFTGFMASEKATALQTSTLYDLLEDRLDKWTLITSNLSPDEMPDVRLASRLFRGNNVVVNMQGAADYAILKYKEKQNHAKEKISDKEK